MNVLVLEDFTWPGGPAAGFALALDAGEARRLEVRGAAALGRALMGGPGGDGRVIFKGENIAALPAWQRARRGLFLASADAVALPGLSLATLLRAGLQARGAQSPRPGRLRSFLAERCRELSLQEKAVFQSWEEAPEPAAAWSLALLAADCFRPELAIFCPPDESSARLLAGRASCMVLLEKP